MLGMSFHVVQMAMEWADIVVISGLLYFLWLRGRDKSSAFKLPMGAKYKRQAQQERDSQLSLSGETLDPNKEEVWFSNSDARTDLLYLGTTGSGVKPKA